MPRLTYPGVEVVYEAAQQFVEVALRNDGSLFTSGQPIWALPVIDDLHHRFVQRPDSSKDSFEVKFQRQLSGAPAGTIQLAGELLYVHFLIARSVLGQTKRDIIGRVLSWSPSPATVPPELDSALDKGIAKVGTAFHTRRDAQLKFLLEFLKRWKGLPASQQTELLQDPWDFKSMLFAIPIDAAYTQRESLLHLVFPDTFEPIVSKDAKRQIATASTFKRFVSDPSNDVDQLLADIRKGLTERFGSDFSFYSPDVSALWQNPVNPWDEFIRWGERFYRSKDFDSRERDYKIEISNNIKQARATMDAGSDTWIEQLKRSFGSPNNIVPWTTRDPFINWCRANPEIAKAALEALWSDRAEPADRVRAFLELLPTAAVGGRGTRANLASFLLLGSEPSQFPSYQITVFQKGFDLTGYESPPRDPSEATLYQHALAFLDSIIEEASQRGVELRDRLDAQGILWCIAKTEPLDDWSEQDGRAFKKWRGDSVGPDDEPDPLGRLAESLLVDRDYLSRIRMLLSDKRQLIFYGPPGTGKTYVARKLAEFFAGEGGKHETVQFHPSYAYEDFFEGYRPKLLNGSPGFDLVEGPLKRLGRAAAASVNQAGDDKYVLLIDEINRGNIAKVFGELYFLLEYRDERISLQYSSEPFALPENLWIIGTMNTADRSIALIDSALRRRFYFVPFFPDEPPIKGLLRRWLEKNKPSMVWVADVVDEANRRLGQRHAAIGPSYFLRTELTEEWVSLIWEHAILPYLAEQFFGEEDRLRDFSLELLRGATRSGNDSVEGSETARA